MIDPIENLIVSRHLPDPTPNLDRRIEQLMFASSTARKVTRKKSAGVLSLVGGSLAACVIGLVCIPSEKTGSIIQNSERSPDSSVVHSIDLEIPSLNLAFDNTTDDREWLFAPGSIVVSTSIKEGDQQ